MKRLIRFLLTVVTGTMLWGMTAFAEEAVTPVDMIMYSNEYTVLYAEPDLTSTVVLPNEGIPMDTPVHVIGVTESGFIQVDLNGTYYIAGNGLVSEPSTGTVAAVGEAPLSLEGNWEPSNPGESYIAGYIVGDIIELYWVYDNGESYALYWSGSYVAPTESTTSYSWVSVNNTAKTKLKIMASNNETKTFTYNNGVLSFSVSALGITKNYKVVQTTNDYTIYAN